MSNKNRFDQKFELAQQLLSEAALAKERGELDLSLDIYQQTLEVLVNLVKSTDDRNPHRQLYLQTASSNMSDAETVKAMIKARNDAVVSTSVFRAALMAPSVSESAQAPIAKVSTHQKAALPDYHDYSSRSSAKKKSSTVSSATSYNGKVGVSSSTPSRKAATPTRANIRGNNNNSSSKANPAEPVTASNKENGGQDEYTTRMMEELVDRSPGVRWEDIAGLSFAKQTLQEAVILPNLRPDLFTGLRSPPKGVLLFGPPGTGKTLLAKAVATESGFAFFAISAASIVSKFVGEGEKLMRALFEVARTKQPAVIFFDEIDSLMSARKDNEHEASRRLKTEFMAQLDGTTSDSKDRLLIMGATNLPWDLDEAVLRRLPKRIYVPLPDDETRASLILHLLKKQNTVFTSAQMQRIVAMTDGYSGSDLAAMCQEAALGPIREIPAAKLKTVKEEEVRAIQEKDFIDACLVIRPSVSPDSLQHFQQWTAQYSVNR